MEKLALMILKYIKKESCSVSFSEIKNKFGDDSGSALSALERLGYVSEETVFKPHQTIHGMERYMGNGKYKITSEGRAYLEEKPGQDFDKWLNRFSTVSSVLGVALLSKPLWFLIEWAWGYLKEAINAIIG